MADLSPFSYELDESAPRPLYLQLRDRLIADIRRGVFPVKSAIPSISALESCTNVSRVTVVRALARLVEDGFIFPQQGKGYYVSARGSKSLLAVVAPFDLRSVHYTSQLLAGVELAAGPAGYDLIEINSGVTAQEFERAVHRAIYERGARSLVVVPPEEAAESAAAFLAALPVQRLVVADRELPGTPLPTVAQDRAAAYRLLAEHLSVVGVRRVATVGFGETTGLLHQALVAVQLEVAVQEFSGDERLDDIAGSCDALCCADDVLAARFYLSSRDDAGHLPIALTGFNHTSHGHVIPGGLTTIDPGLLEMGLRVVELIDHPAPAAPPLIHVAPRLIIGATTTQLQHTLNRSFQ